MTSSGEFTLRKVFYTVPSRLIGHQLRVRLYDDRLDVFVVGSTHLVTLPRGRGQSSGKHDQIVDYRHVIHSLRSKPMALLNLAYRDRLLSRDVYRRTFDQLRQWLSDQKSCRLMVDLLALAHERGCEAELADQLAADPDARQLPDIGRLRARFAPDLASVPNVVVHLAPLTAYECLLGADRRRRQQDRIDGRLVLERDLARQHRQREDDIRRASPWHLGQWRLRQVMGDAHYLPYGLIQ